MHIRRSWPVVAGSESDTASSATTTTPATPTPGPNTTPPLTLKNRLTQTAMEGWSKFSSSLNNINFAQAGTKFTKGFNSSVQATRERLGQVAPDEITELPQGEWLLVGCWPCVSPCSDEQGCAHGRRDC